MAYKASKSRAPAGPSIYKIESNRLLGIDASTADNNASLARACGVSYFETETGIGTDATPGILNMIRTKTGEIAKRTGAKEVEIRELSDSNIIENSTKSVKKVITIGNDFLKVTINNVSNNATADYRYGLHLYKKYDNHFEHYGFSTGIDAGVHEFNGAVTHNNTAILFFSSYIVYFNFQIEYNASLEIIKPFTIISANGIYYDNAASRSYNEYHNWLDEGFYAPIIYIGGTKNGGSGKGYEPVNCLCPYVRESLRVENGDNVYITPSLSTADISLVPEIELLDSDGNWYRTGADWKTENGINKIYIPQFNSVAPAGEDNIRIIYARAQGEREKTFSKIANCNKGCAYGVGGYKDRLFLTGNSNYPNFVFYSAMDKNKYFPDLNYLTFNDTNCEVKALAGQDTSLCVITDNNCYLIGAAANGGDTSEYSPDALFKIIRVFESAKPTENCEPLVFNNEIVYLSKSGVVSITPSNVMDERYVQVRSERVNYWLLKENIDNMQCCVCGNFFVINNIHSKYLYLLDGNQFSTSDNKPFSHRQYEAFIFDNLIINNMWSINDVLYFENIKNEIFSLNFDVEVENRYFSDSPKSTRDGNSSIKAYFETQNIYGADFYNKKSFSKFGVLLRRLVLNAGDVCTGIKVWYKRNNEEWKVLKEYDKAHFVFRYDAFRYDLFSYMPTVKSYTYNKKIKIKKAYGLKLRFENSEEDMPFCIQEYGLQYTQ